jgi:hypothetical protein
MEQYVFVYLDNLKNIETIDIYAANLGAAMDEFNDDLDREDIKISFIMFVGSQGKLVQIT